MKTFTRGEKSRLADLGLGTRLAVAIDMPAPGITVDLSCFGLDAADRLADERYMIFYNQPASPEGAIRVDLSTGRAVFTVDLDAVPASIAKLVFTGAVDGNGTMRGIGNGTLKLGDGAAFPFAGSDFQEEKAVILGELYRRDGQWRFGAVGQGFNGGLAALLAHFGGEAAAPTAAPVSAPAPAPAPAKISLSKVTLEKRGDKVSLEKKGGGRGFGKIRVNLNWNRGGGVAPEPEKKGLFGGMFGAKKSNGIDLDLGCLFELADGRPGCVQALGDAWGRFDEKPFIALDSDDRTGTSTTGENMHINGDRFDEIRRVLVFAFIYEGVPNWAATDGVVTIEVPGHPTVEVRLDHGANERMCAIASIENRNGELQVTKLVDYIGARQGTGAHQVMDQKYGFGLRWAAGSKG